MVAYSQGNLYVNAAHLRLGKSDITTFAAVGVTTPANNVLGAEGPYVTLENDIIVRLPIANLPANTSNSPLTGEPCSSTDFLGFECHSFIDSYLKGSVSRNRILDATIAHLPVPIGVSKTGTGTGTVTSDLPGINCGHNCIAAFPQFTNGVNTRLTLTASADPGSSFTAWSGECVQIGTAARYSCPGSELGNTREHAHIYAGLELLLEALLALIQILLHCLEAVPIATATRNDGVLRSCLPGPIPDPGPYCAASLWPTVPSLGEWLCLRPELAA